jgi:hypothetical protein
LLITISACSAPVVKNATQASTTTPASLALTLTTKPTKAVETPSKSPTPSLEVIMTSTLVTPLDGWDQSFISRIPVKDVSGLTPEEIMTKLVTQWLEYYKTKNTDDDYGILDYTIVSINPDDSPRSPNDLIVARVFFDVKPVKIQSEWIVGSGVVFNKDWIHTQMVFGIFQDGDNYRLKDLLGWGT